MRGIAFIVGVVLLGATAHVTITATGGYGEPHAVLTLAIAAGVAVAALAIGAAWAGRRRGLAAWLVLAIAAGELFGLLMTAERLITAREAAQAPLRAAAELHAKALQRVAQAEAAVSALPRSSPRLDTAIAAKAAADQAAIDKAAERGCRENCRQLLQAQVDQAGAEIAAARAELSAKGEASKGELDASRAALAAIKAPASATPLADRLGLPAWALDLIAAALGSMAANGLGCGLIAFAGHGRRPEPASAEIIAAAPAIPAHEHAGRFAVERLWPAEGGSVDVQAVHAAYRDWCAEKGIPPLSGAAIARSLADLFDRAGIPVADQGGRLAAMGVALRAEPIALIANQS